MTFPTGFGHHIPIPFKTIGLLVPQFYLLLQMFKEDFHCVIVWSRKLFYQASYGFDTSGIVLDF